MGLWGMLTGGRGASMRKEYEDAKARMKDANAYELRGYYSNIQATWEHAVEFYANASSTERKEFMTGIRGEVQNMWQRGMWPQAVGAIISVLHAESAFVEGEDAAFVKREAAKIIADAQKFMEEVK